VSGTGRPAEERIREALAGRLAVWEQAGRCAGAVAELANGCVAALRAGGQILFCGNGGSAAQADHLAAELVGRYAKERRALRATALVTSGALLTAIANDYGYEAVFARQIEAAARPGDVLVALSTSGRSPSILRALEAARDAGCRTALFTGDHRDAGLPGVDHLVSVPSRLTPAIQELHLFLGHLLCEIIEDRLADHVR
jgi:D-sedoheptulose 7-phosphate isomerase